MSDIPLMSLPSASKNRHRWSAGPFTNPPRTSVDSETSPRASLQSFRALLSSSTPEYSSPNSFAHRRRSLALPPINTWTQRIQEKWVSWRGDVCAIATTSAMGMGAPPTIVEPRDLRRRSVSPGSLVLDIASHSAMAMGAPPNLVDEAEIKQLRRRSASPAVLSEWGRRRQRDF